MKRRTFLTGLAATGALIGTGSALMLGKADVDLSIGGVLAKLDGLQANPPSTTGAWNLAQILMHCAQSVEYSLSGFPVHKSEAFKRTAGSLAFAVFCARGAMTHGLSEPIPGAPALVRDGDLALAFQGLRATLLAFQHHQGPMAPHFAYGELTKAEYELAHALHFYNHMEEMV